MKLRTIERSVAYCMLLLLLPIFVNSCNRNEEIPFRELLNDNLEFAKKQYLLMADELAKQPGRLPYSINDNGNLITCGPRSWTSGFFPGSLWYLYNATQDNQLKELAEHFTSGLEHVKNNTNNHDLGWIFNSSYVNGYRLTKDEAYKNVITQSVNSLLIRYNPVVGCIRCWDESERTIRNGWEFPVNIDNIMNLELVMQAYKLSGDSMYLNIARQHADNTMKNHFRSDFSSFHLVDFDPETGEAKKKQTVQGHNNESTWARGQAWGFYGFTMMYRETGDPAYLNLAKNIADFIIHHPNMPEDKIPYWDFNAPNIPNAYKDASAGAIMCSALIELSQFVDKAQSEEYLTFAVQQLQSFFSDQYRSNLGENGNFILKHSVGALYAKHNVDKPANYTDYYFIEAMVRYKQILDNMPEQT